MANDAPLLLDVTRLVWRRWKGRHPTGIDRVCLAYLERFGSDAQAVVQHRRFRRILDVETSTVLFRLLSQPRSDFRSALISQAFRLGLRRSCEGRGRGYLNIGHTGLNDEGFRTWVQNADVRPIYFVHDLIPITNPEFCRAGERDKHCERMRTVLTTAAGVIANSQVTLEDLRAFAASERLASPPAAAAFLGSDALPSPERGTSERLDRPTFAIVGTIEARKNHLMMLEIWRQLVADVHVPAPRLLIIGQRGWECDEVFKLLDRGDFLPQTVIEMGRCDDRTLTAHLASARALLFPSLVEGYGLPLVEALRAQVPVIASDLPVFREIAGDVPDYLDPEDAPAWKRMILSYANDDSSQRAAQLKRLAGYRAPTWESHFATVESWMSKL